MTQFESKLAKAIGEALKYEYYHGLDERYGDGVDLEEAGRTLAHDLIEFDKDHRLFGLLAEDMAGECDNCEAGPAPYSRNARCPHFKARERMIAAALLRDALEAAFKKRFGLRAAFGHDFGELATYLATEVVACAPATPAEG